MKIHTLLFFGLLLSSLPGQELPPVAPMPVLPAPLPHELNSALYPVGRFDWFQRVAANIQKGKQAAATCELVFDGDSITDLWQTTGKDVWAQRYAKYNAFDFGISGDQTQHLLWRLTQGQATGMHPKLIALLIGTNNIANTSAERIAEAVKAIVVAYQTISPDSVILVQAVFPRGEKPDDPVRLKIKQLNAVLAKLDDGKKVITIDFGDKFLQPDGTISREIMPDFLHPSAKGYQIWADAIQSIIDRYLPAK
ncbi:MAG TPA: GDSL-type esterase/lipase family protein [Candidatus Methylacidiphilales bacterium]